MHKVIKRINEIVDNAIQCMADNSKINYKEFIYACERIEEYKQKLFKQIALSENSLDMNTLISVFEAKVALQNAVAVGITKRNIGELTEE